MASKILKALKKKRKIVEVKKVKCRTYDWNGVDVEIIDTMTELRKLSVQ